MESMSDTWLLSAIAQHMRDLLCCDDVSILLACHEALYRHPLLEQVSASLAEGTGNDSLSATAFVLADERRRAICDIAIQTGAVWSFMEALHPSPQSPIRFIAPLWRPRGIVGLVICTTTYATGFGPGEYRLLYQQLAPLALQVEQVLEYICMQQASWLYPHVQADHSYETNDSDDQATSLTRSNSMSVEQEPILSEQDIFFSMISHDLRLPLSIIKGYVGLLQVYGCTGEDEWYAQQLTMESQRSYLKAVMEQVQHMEVLVADLLDLSRLQARQLTLRPTALDLLELCQRVARQMQDRVEQQAAGRFTIRCPGERKLPLVWADEHRVRQILENLLENAIKYSPDGGLIEILVYSTYPFTIGRLLPSEDNVTAHAQEGASLISITIRDHGIGIPQWQQALVFKPFQRLEQPATRQIAGLGLGLYIVRKLVEAMHGSIILKSKEGQGTSITLTLPIAMANSSTDQINTQRFAVFHT